MFDFFNMAGNYDLRKVAHDEEGDLIVDTAAVTDGRQPYETAVCHPCYNNGRWVIVEAYDTTQEAQAGHERWFSELKTTLPPYLRDCCNCGLSELLDTMDEKYSLFPYTEKKGGTIDGT